MKLLLGFIALVSIVGCNTMAPLTPMQIKRDKIIACIKDLKQNDSATMDSFEVCRQVYRLEKLP